jgi:platelet-activating factor acetylhydrolase IB subunit alpha
VKTLDDAHGHFVSCIRWAPGIIKDVPATNGDTNGTLTNGTAKKDDAARKVNIRCVIATGSVDLNVRVFAS